MGSPSSRRAWIEIRGRRSARPGVHVALLTEGVDRNWYWWTSLKMTAPSPSSRRAWIEMHL